MVQWEHLTLECSEESIGSADGESLSHGSPSGGSSSSRKGPALQPIVSGWLEAARRKHGLGINVVVFFRVQSHAVGQSHHLQSRSERDF